MTLSMKEEEAWGSIEHLRSAAEAKLAELESSGAEWPGALVHELELHRIELEMQNQALQEMRVEAENAMARLSEIKIGRAHV